MSTSACFMTSEIWSDGDRRAVVLVEVRDQRPVGGEHRGCCRPASCRSARPAGRRAATPSCGPPARCRRPRAAAVRRAAPRRRRSSRRASRWHGSGTAAFSDIAGECTCRERLLRPAQRRRAGRIRVRGVPVGVSASAPVSSAPMTRSPSRSCTSPAVGRHGADADLRVGAGEPVGQVLLAGGLHHPLGVHPQRRRGQVGARRRRPRRPPPRRPRRGSPTGRSSPAGGSG